MIKSKITRIEIFPAQIPLSEPFVISKGALTHARTTIVRIHSDQGLYGTGECCPFRSIHAETQAGTVAIAKDLAAACWVKIRLRSANTFKPSIECL
jgi:L-alanine-DL-glutamate epimerase-like enolase superfamily enzyme